VPGEPAPDTVTEALDAIVEYGLDNYFPTIHNGTRRYARDEITHAIVTWVEQNYVPRADYESLRAANTERVTNLNHILRERDQLGDQLDELRQAVADLAQRWETEATAIYAVLEADPLNPIHGALNLPRGLKEARRAYHLYAGAAELQSLTQQEKPTP
jgi:hypothetical protein